MTDLNIRLIDKPSGITSFDVIRQLRKKEGISKAGHAGTLDPLASGLLLVGVGREGTKQLNDLVGLDKTYQVTAELGVGTDTGDRDGEVVEEVPVPELSRAEIEQVVAGLAGELELPVPRYSAVKVGGEKLYQKARRGEDFTPPVRQMRVYETQLLDARRENERMFLTLELRVASGVYVRSVVEELGRRLGTVATVAELRRTRIGEYKVEDAERLQ